MRSHLFFQKDRWWSLLVAVLILLSLWVVIVVYNKISINEKLQMANNTEADLYWLEQTIHGHIGISQRQIMTMMNDIQRQHQGNKKERFIDDSLQVMKRVPSITSIEWYDIEGRLRTTVSIPVESQDLAPVTRRLLEEEAIRDARAQNAMRGVGPFKKADGDYELSLIQPMYSQTNQLTGFIKTQRSIRRLFDGIAPKWFVDKYHLRTNYNSETLYAIQHEGFPQFDDAQLSAKREMKINGIDLLLRTQLYPGNQVWILRSLFAGMVFLLLTLLVSLLALRMDMRRRRAAEKQIISQNNLRQAIEMSLNVGIRAHAMDGSMIYVNPAFCEMIGYAAEEIINVSLPLPYIPKEENPKLVAIRERLLINPQGESIIEIKMRKKSGEIIDTIMRGGPMYDDEGRHTGWITSVEDITERKRLEVFQENEQKRLETVNHLISMGEMASNIAHELNQPLSAISGYATGLSNYIQKDEKTLSRERLIEVTEKIRRQAERAANVIRRVQQFAKQKSITPIDLHVSHLIEQVIDFMELEVKQKGCYIENHVKNPNLPSVYMDNTMAQQILINVLRNAIDVMVEYNVIDKRIDIYAEEYSVHHILVRITDKGPGVPADKVETIFQPFYTTKTQGIGIGLNICRTMIESNGGRLWAKADANGGIFYLTMPVN